ncbi:MAG: PCRF domain-containing protein [Vicinamibacterales bacterium]
MSLERDRAIGGLKEVIVNIEGQKVYSRLKFESGVHRVQRVPDTEASGRIHTSTATVAVLPEAEEVDVHIDEEGPTHRHLLFQRSRRSERQHDLLGRPHHAHSRPGSSCSQQDEKSQIKNRAKAMKVLRVAPLRDGAAEAAGRQRQGTAWARSARVSAPRRSAPTTSRRAASPITASTSRRTSS